MGGRAAVIFDLGGTLGEDDGDIRNFDLYPDSVAALRTLGEAGWASVIVTNQSGIARGGFSRHDFDVRMATIEGQARGAGASWPGIYCCPHAASDACGCRKPKPGLAHRAAEELDLDLSRSVVIGDSGYNDMLLARGIGARAVLVRTGWGEGSLGEFRHLRAEMEADFIAADAMEAVGWVLAHLVPRSLLPRDEVR